VPVTSWSDFLELTHAAFDCNKVRFMADMSGKPAGSLLDVDVFYSGNWHSVYMAQPADDTWVEADISGTVEVTAARARFYNPDAVIQHNFWLKEFDFWGVEGGKLTVTNQSILWALLQLHEIVGSGYIYVDNDRVFHWLDDIGEDKGQQIRYRKNLEGITRETDWGSLCTRLYPIGNGVQLSDLTVFKEALE